VKVAVLPSANVSPFTLGLYIGLGVAIGVLIGVIMGFFIGARTTMRNPVFRPFLQTGLIGIFYDVDSDSLSIEPIERRGDIYITKGNPPAIYIPVPSATPIRIKGSTATAVFGISGSVFRLATDLKALHDLGIAEIVVNEKRISTERSNPYSEIVDAARRLASSHSDSLHSLTVDISPDVRIGITYSIGTLARRLAQAAKNSMLSVFEGANYAYATGSRMEALLSRMYAVRTGSPTWLRYLFLFLLIGLAAFIVMQALKSSPTAIHAVGGIVTHILTTTP
jgi:hypothetical protein